MQLIEGHVAVQPPSGVPQWDIDPYSDEVLTNLEDYYAELRRRGAFVYLRRYAMLACGRFQETRQVFSDWQRFVSSRGVGLTDFKLTAPWRPASVVLEVDPPYHTTTRRVIMRALSPRAIAAWKATLQSAADSLIEELLKRGSFDAITDLAEVFPTTVFPPAVGLTETDPRRLLDYGAMVFNALGPDNELRRRWLAKAPDIVPWITAQCRRECLTRDGFGAAIYEAVDRGEITDQEAGLLVRSLLSAGIDTTATALGSAVWCLARYPAAFAQLHGNPSLARLAFEETLRLTSPVHTFCRTAAAATVIGGVPIPQDAKILCVLGAANLDPDHWPDAATFHLNRNSQEHLAFGIGIHGCVGQLVARAEAEAVLSAIARKVRGIELTGLPVWRAGNAIHALGSLPVRFLPK